MYSYANGGFVQGRPHGRNIFENEIEKITLNDDCFPSAAELLLNSNSNRFFTVLPFPSLLCYEKESISLKPKTATPLNLQRLQDPVP